MYLPDILLLDFLLIDLLDGVCQIVIEVDLVRTDEDYIATHGLIGAEWQTILVVEDYLSDLEVFGVI